MAQYGASRPSGRSGGAPRKGGPKQRWSNEQRQARGAGPRGASRDDRGDARRDDRGGDARGGFDRGGERGFQRRDDRGFDRGGERGFQRRDDRAVDRGASRFGRGDRDDNRGEGRENRSHGERRFDDRGSNERSFDRGGERGFQRRDDRGPSRGGFNRDDNRGGRFQRDDRSGGRDERFGRDERPARSFNRDDERGGERFARSSAPRASRPVYDHHPKRDDWRRPERPRRDERFDNDRSNDSDADTMEWTAQEIEVSEDAVNNVDATAGFGALGVAAPLVAALEKQGITQPFPIQAATIPDAISGRDVLGRGQTGSGKTLGFGLPMLTRLANSEKTNGLPRAVILVPTRELALQVADVLAPLARTLRLDLVLVAGGMAYGPQLKAFERGVDIVVATPGRLIDLMDQGAADLTQVQVTVLDEADHMADLGFVPEVRRILDTVPADGQRLLFSATLDHAVDRIVREYLHDPITHQVDESRAAVTTMEHAMYLVKPSDKEAVTAAIANREGRTVVFVRTQLGANRVAEQLRSHGIMAGALHGGLTQGARARMLQAFRDGTVPVLVATDVAARGIHVDDVSLVLQVDPPMNSKDYLHRAGRTARAGTKGVVVSLSLPHQRRSTSRLLGAAGVKHEPVQVDTSDELMIEQTGARNPSEDSISEGDFNALIAPRQAARKGGRPGGRGQGGRGQGGGRGGYGGGRGRGNGGGRSESWGPRS